MKIKLFTVLVLPAFQLLAAAEWINPNVGKADVSYVYAPGIFCSEVHLAKYRTPFEATTGEKISCDCGIQTIGDNSVACNFAEIRPNQLNSLLARSVTKPVRLVTGWFTRQRGIKIDRETGDGTHSVANHSIAISKVNIGQKQDMEIYRQAVQKQLQKSDSSDQKLILYGTSRGSATVFNYYAHHDSPEVAAVVCEGVFDSIPNITSHGGRLTKAKIKALKRLKVTDFRVDGPSPIESVDLIKVDKPIALITSEVDRVVPMACTVNLYKKLRAKGFTKVHLLRLKDSEHSVYPTSVEKEDYQAFMHAFYQKYGLPHIPEYADLGQKLLEQSQPDL